MFTAQGLLEGKSRGREGQRSSLLVILSKLLLRSEGSGRAARTVAFFATE